MPKRSRISAKDDMSSNDGKFKNEYKREFEELKLSCEKLIKKSGKQSKLEEIFEVEEEEIFMDVYVRMVIIGESLTNKYAWAIPDDTAIRICQHFEPLIEIGCGRGYWNSLLSANNVEITSFDREFDKDKDEKERKNIGVGGPDRLKQKKFQDHNLFLCYPDQDYELGLECLQNLNNNVEYVLHVGELMQTGTVIGNDDQRPFGRTSSSEFQVLLYQKFHCVIQHKLPSFPISQDYLTVWKRTEFIEAPCLTASADPDIDFQDTNDDGDGDGENGEEHSNLWASIPQDECLPLNIAAPKYRWLLD